MVVVQGVAASTTYLVALHTPSPTLPHHYTPEDDVHDAETDSSDDDDPMGNEEHPDIAERVLYCRVDPSEEIKKLKEPTLQGNQRV